jgi:tetratricopeptide (TPR) repeat protein
MRVWTLLNEVKLISIEIIDLLINEETDVIDEEAFHDLLDVFEESDVFGIKLYDSSFTMDELYRLQTQKKADRDRIEYIESLFFEGGLTKHPEALDIAYTVLLVEPFAYHVLIFMMDQALKDGISNQSISYLEAFVSTFEEVEKEWINGQPQDLNKPSDLREYCFGLSSIAMFYLEEENYQLAIKYYEKLLALDQKNIFHAKEYILRAYMFNNQFDRYSDILESLPDISVYKRFLLLYRKIQLLEDDMEEYLEETIKHYGYLFQLLIDEKESDLSGLPEIEEDFLIEYG